MTSIITSTVEGVKTEGGVSGFFSGLGKGLVGTVTKPVAGALDFASETAQTVRDMASLSNHRWVKSSWGFFRKQRVHHIVKMKSMLRKRGGRRVLLALQ